MGAGVPTTRPGAPSEGYAEATDEVPPEEPADLRAEAGVDGSECERLARALAERVLPLLDDELAFAATTAELRALSRMPAERDVLVLVLGFVRRSLTAVLDIAGA
jgi:hypothetical protein